MCGLIAIISKKKVSVDRDLFSACLSTLKHRGPDNASIYTNPNIAMGHTRLAIIDRSSQANQPFTENKFGNYLIFNGEIYNYREIRKDLTNKGINFRTESDTEVLYMALSIYGSSIIPKLNGMFAFVFWDQQKKLLTISRDRYGIKPLFYYENDRELIFASEIKAILAYLEKTNSNQITVNTSSLNEYLVFQNIISEHTFYSGIRKFRAGTCREILITDRELISSHKMYWNWKQNAESLEILSDYDLHLSELIEKSVQKQLIGDVNLGTFLSGGLDSSVVTYFAAKNSQKLESFSIGFEFPVNRDIENFSDEIEEAREIAEFLGIKNHSKIVTETELHSTFSDINLVLEEPRMGQSYPNYFASKLASQHSTVVLSGAGGDELFGGYPWRYEISQNCSSWDSLVKHHFNTSHKLLAYNEINHLLKNSVDYGDINRPKMLHKEFFSFFTQRTYSEENAINAIMSYDAEIFLEGLLGVEDKIGMSFSIETRFPFLDNNLVDFVIKYGKIRSQFSGRDLWENKGKKDLRSLATQLLPSKVANREKQGFTGPDAFWFRSDNSAKFFSKLLGKQRAIWDYLDYDKSMQYLNLHQSGHRNLRHLIWSMLSLSNFFEKFGK